MKFKTLLIGLAMAAGIGSTAHSAVVMSTNVPVAIPDVTTVSSTLNVTSHLIISDVNALLSSLTHTFDSDLRITLTAPNATVVILSNRRGGAGQNFIGTIFDDQAATAIAAGAAPFTGSFRPDGALSIFNGIDAFGIWTLTVADTVALDSGSINAWGLDLNGRQVGEVPEPGSLALLSLALLGLGLARRKQG